MKKLTIILLTFFYLLPAIGFSIDIHWCGNKVQTLKLASSPKKRCPCGEKMPKGCCKDTHSVIKLTDNQNSVSTVNTPTNNYGKQLVNSPAMYVVPFLTRITVFEFTTYHAPPDKNGLPIYLTNHTFRI